MFQATKHIDSYVLLVLTPLDPDKIFNEADELQHNNHQSQVIMNHQSSFMIHPDVLGGIAKKRLIYLLELSEMSH